MLVKLILNDKHTNIFAGTPQYFVQSLQSSYKFYFHAFQMEYREYRATLDIEYYADMIRFSDEVQGVQGNFGHYALMIRLLQINSPMLFG